MQAHAIDVEKVQETLSELVEQATEDGEVILTRDGEPVAKIVPIFPEQARLTPRKAGSAKGLIKIADDFDEPLEEFRDYM